MECMSFFVDTGNDDGSVSNVLKEEAYNTICDLLVIFCNQLSSQTNPLLHQLVYEPNQAMQEMLNRYQIFIWLFFETKTNSS